MKESVLKAIKQDGVNYIFNHELNEDIIKKYVFETIIKKLTLEDMNELVQITPILNSITGNLMSQNILTSDTYNNFLVEFNLKFQANFSFSKRLEVMNLLLLK